MSKNKAKETRPVCFDVQVVPLPRRKHASELAEPVTLKAPWTKVPEKWVLVDTENGKIIRFKANGDYA